MTTKEKATIKEVVAAGVIHLGMVKNHLIRHRRMTDNDLQDIADGLALSLDKLDQLTQGKE